MKKLVSIYILLFLSQALVAQEQLQAIKNVLERIETYQYGQPENWKPDLLKAMQPVYEKEQLQKQVEALMLEFILSDASLSAKRAISKELSVIATPAAEKPLFKLLSDAQSAAMALEILALSDLGEVAQFQQALKKAAPDTRIGIINLLGSRGEKESASLLAKQLPKAAEKEKEAIAFALAKIATPEAASILQNIDQPAMAVNRAKVNAGFLLIDNGFNKEAEELFTSVYQQTDFVPLKSAALNGLFELSNQKVTFIKEQLRQSSPSLHSYVIRLIIKLPADYKNGQELLNLENLSTSEQRQLLTILAKRGDTSIRKEVVKLLQQENEPELKTTALQVIPVVGNEEDVELLAQLATQSTGEEKQLAENALYALPGEAVDEKIKQLLASSTKELKPALLKAIGRRNITDASAELFKLMQSENTTVKMEAIEASGQVADADQLPAAVDQLMQAGSRRERKSLEEAVYLIAARNPNLLASSAIIKDKLDKAWNKNNIVSLLTILGQLANPDDYTVMQTYLQHEEADVQSAVIKAWEEWPDSQPLPALKEMMQSTEDERQHALAMKSYLQIVNLNEKMSSDEKIRHLNTANQMSQNIFEKRMVVAGYAKIHEPASLTQLMALLPEQEIKAEVEVAIQEVSRRIWENNAWVIAQLKKIIEASDNQKFVAELKKEIERRTN